MKKMIKNFAGLVFGAVVFAATLLYYKYQETDYDSIIAQAKKIQLEHSEYYDFYGETEPDFPESIVNSKTILGIDANKNGVRDDVDIWINRTAYDKNETKAMRQFAKAKQDWLNSCEKQSREKMSSVNSFLAKAAFCLESLSDYQRKTPGFAKDKLEILILNTKSRRNCTDFYSSSPLPQKIFSGDPTHFYCDFEIEYYNLVVFGNHEWKK